MAKEYHKQIRKPIAPPTKVFGSKRDYDRRKNTVTDFDLREALAALANTENIDESIVTSPSKGAQET